MEMHSVFSTKKNKAGSINKTQKQTNKQKHTHTNTQKTHIFAQFEVHTGIS